MKNSRLIIPALLLITISFIVANIYKSNNHRRQLKEDLVELSSIKYGLFNMDEWKQVIAEVLTKKVNEFELKGQSRAQTKKKIADFLYVVINDMEKRFYQQNSGGILGILKSGVASFTGTFDQLKKDVPIFTEQVLNFLNDPENKKAVKNYLLNKINNYADSTFSKTDYRLHDLIIQKYGYGNRAQSIQALEAGLITEQAQTDLYKYILLSLSIITAAFMLMFKNINKVEFFLLTCICFLFLISGLTLPMIEIDARISELKMSVLGEDLVFKNQVLYYKSKSILEVVRLMLSQNGIDVIVIGLLVLLFSVLFPVSKLIASVLLLFSHSLKNKRFINFLVYKTGKWSMADVMVVAVFMAYIGFSGILNEQLGQLNNFSSNIDIISTNHSALQVGFFAFTAFVILSLLLTGKLKQLTAEPVQH